MKTLVRRSLLSLASLYLLGTLFGGAFLGSVALRPPRRVIAPSEAANVEAAANAAGGQFADVSITTPDGTSLSAWFIRPPHPNGDAVILLHGVSDNRLGMYGYGKWLLENNYAVLLPDARGHGLSGGVPSYGIHESNDIHNWVSWLEENEHPHCVFGLGESMGAAQLLQSIPKEPRFCAVVAESPFATFREVAYARLGRQVNTGPWLGRTFFRPTVEVGFLYLRLHDGLNMENASPDRAVEGTTIPIMLIRGLDDSNIPPFHSDEIQTHNPWDIVVWKVPGAAHTGAHQTAPEEFERRVLAWFQSHSQSPSK
jgi:uncharacterized protein